MRSFCFILCLLMIMQMERINAGILPRLLKCCCGVVCDNDNAGDRTKKSTMDFSHIKSQKQTERQRPMSSSSSSQPQPPQFFKPNKVHPDASLSIQRHNFPLSSPLHSASDKSVSATDSNPLELFPTWIFPDDEQSDSNHSDEQSTPASDDTITNPWKLSDSLPEIITNGSDSSDESETEKAITPQSKLSNQRRSIKVEDTKYMIDHKISEGPFGTVYKGHKIGNDQSSVAIKMVIGRKSYHELQRGDSYSEYSLCKVLSQYQKKGNLTKNIVGILDVKWCALDPLRHVQYIIIFDWHVGTLRSLMDLRQKQIEGRVKMGIEGEINALKMTLNLLKQCLSALKELQSIYPGFKHNDWSPSNILVSDVSLPIREDINYKLCDFGKCRPNRHKFGTAHYASAVRFPKRLETHDINSMAVMAVEFISLFGSSDDGLWRSVQHSLQRRNSEYAMPDLRDKELRNILDSGHFPFKHDLVNGFVRALIHFCIRHDADFEGFEYLISETEHFI